MKNRILIALAALAVAVPASAQIPGFQCPVPPRSMYRQGRLIFNADPPGRSSLAYSSSPSSGLAAAVAITGTVAAGLRMLEEATKPPTVPVIVTTPSSDCEVVLPPELQKASAPPVIVIPEDTGITEVHVVPMEPVVKHPVPITVVPMEIATTR